MKILKVRDVKTPERGTPFSAGLDFFVPSDIDWHKDCKGSFYVVGGAAKTAVRLYPGESILIPSGIKVQVPKGKALVFFDKSSIAAKQNLLVGAPVVDEDYQGEVHLNVHYVGDDTAFIEKGQKLVQGLLLDVSYEAVEECEFETDLFPEVSERGAGGFGSTNK